MYYNLLNIIPVGFTLTLVKILRLSTGAHFSKIFQKLPYFVECDLINASPHFGESNQIKKLYIWFYNALVYIPQVFKTITFIMKYKANFLK